MELNGTEWIAGSSLRLETFDDSSNGDNLTNDELQRENLVLCRQMEEMRSSLQSSNLLRTVVHNELPELSASTLDGPAQMGGEGLRSSRPTSPQSSILSHASAAIGSPMSRLIHRIGKFIDIVKVTAESHGDNLEIVKDLQKEGCDLILRADRLPQTGISVEELEAFEDAYNDLSRTLLELLNKKGILSKIG